MSLLITDENLAAKTLAGDRTAYRELMNRHYRKVFHLCRSILRHAEDAEDATQEVFVRAFQALGQYQGRGAFGGWLRRLTVNHCLNRMQTASAKVAARSHSLDLLAESLTASQESDPEEKLLRAEERDRIQCELDQLPAQQRAALALLLLEGLAYDEIAEILGVPVNTVRSWIHRGRARLREALQETVEC